MSESENKGTSKNELKKLAKKSEKAAKKQAAKEGADGNAPGGGATTMEATEKESVPTAAPESMSLPPPPKLLLFQGAKDDPATLKAVWAAMKFNVNVGVAKQKHLPPGCNSASRKPLLIYGNNDYVLGGGGNAMCKAIALMGGEHSSYQADELCEMERTSLRLAVDGSKLKLDALAAALEHSSTGNHLVGDYDTFADICIVVTLSKFANDHIGSWPVSVQKYYQCHVTALEQAKAAVENYLPTPPVAMDDPRALKLLASIFACAFEDIAPDAELPETIIKKCDNVKHGDYQCSAAMPAFASLKKSNKPMPPGVKGPPELAQAVIDALGTNHPVVQDLRLQGPGFIMFKLSLAYLQNQVQSILDHKSLLKPKMEPIKCLVDFSSPNIAKEMHVGHLRSTIIGESVCRILEFVDCEVERVNHVGDWGTQFGMLIQYLKEEYPDFADSTPNITDLTAFYKNAKAKFDEDADFKKASQLNVGKLQSGDEEFLKVWKLLCDISRKEFQKVYDRLDVTLYEYGESFYNAMIPQVVEEFDKAGKLSIEEGGAKCVFVDDFSYPLMLQKSDGGFGYDSTDMAALKYRLHTVKAQRIIVITDFSQADHFTMCNQAARDIGWVDKGQRLQHIGFGTVQGEDGKRFKTRSGDTVRLVDLLDEAVARMEASLQDRTKQGKANFTNEEIKEVAEAIGYGAVKYFDLKRNPTSNYKFSYDAMLDTKGDTAVYLLYARARFESIMTKAQEEHNLDVEELIQSGEKIVLFHESERRLALQLTSFTDVIEATLEDLYPYRICEYVYNLSIAASDFVTQCRVLGSPEMKSRLLLCYVTTMAMQQCFDLLGIRKVKRI